MVLRARPRARTAVVVASLATIVAATSIVGCTLLLVSTDGLSGGPDDAAAATVDGQGADTGDAGNPATSGDSAVDPNADAAAAGDADASAQPFCASHPGHTFCDDFDDGTNVAAKWSNTDVEGRGVIGADSTLARSAPRSFASFTPAGTTVISIAKLQRSVGTSDHLRLAFDLQVTTPSGAVGDSIATMTFDNDYLDILWYDSGRLAVTERTTTAANIDHVASKMLPPGSWVRLQIDSTPGHIVMTYDGVSVIDATTTHSFSGGASVGLGLYSNDAESIALHYDNVLIDTAF